MLAGSIGLAVFAPLWMLILAALLGGVTTACFVPGAFRPLVRPRWVVLCTILILPSIFLAGPLDRSILGISYSSQGLLATFYALLRMVVIFLAVSVFTSAVEISALAGVFEKLGLHGLGFSMVVAMNLLPSLQQSALSTWRVLQMRGGFRHQRWKGLRLITITVITQALNRAEEIALAAEVRAFTPEKARAYPIAHGKLDGMIIAASTLAVVAAILVRFI
jgi:energy-coupling factor transporter transmembrane protein EcfT